MMRDSRAVVIVVTLIPGRELLFMRGNLTVASPHKLAQSHSFPHEESGWNVVYCNRREQHPCCCILSYYLPSLVGVSETGRSVSIENASKPRKVLAATLSVLKQNTRRLSNRSRGRMTSGNTHIYIHTYTDKRTTTMKTTTDCCSVANREGCSSRRRTIAR